MISELETDRTLLRMLGEEWAPEILEYYIRNRSFLEEWSPKREGDFYTLKKQREYLKRDLKDIENGNKIKLWLYLKDTSKIIGLTNFSSIIRGGFQSCFLGYSLDKDEINKGYMTEALDKGIDYMLNQQGLHRIEANIMPRNKRSLRVAEKLGFKNEGLALKYLKINGVWEDHLHMVLLNE